MSNKMTNCKFCGQEIASIAKICPSCGAKVKKPIFKKWWFWLIVILILIGIIAGTSGNSEKSTSSTSESTSTSTSSVTNEISYTVYDVTELFDAVDANALKAQNDLKGQYIEIHGYLSNIDSDGAYISVGSAKSDYDHMFDSIHCNIKSSNKSEILDKVMNMNIEQDIVVKGKVTDVGEVLGIFLDIDSIE